jgi:pimeloyl-ACP methyl ester carboxylesterase
MADWAAAETPVQPVSTKRKVKTWLRDKIARDEDLAGYGIALDRNWREVDAERDIVLLVHGFNSEPQHNDEVLKPIRAAGFACGWFRYPNDHAIERSGDLLAEELREFRTQHPERRIALVAHSMGGLVARACIEDSSLDPGNVHRLIMIAPPTKGTFLANYAIGTDLWEHGLGKDKGGPIDRVRASFADGLCEAIEDLKPGSECLRRLNARPRNARVAYTVFLGTGALMYDSDLKWLRRAARWGGKTPLIGRQIDSAALTLHDLDEVLAGKGDGVVAVRRGYLPGVKDTVVYNFRHLSITGPPDSEAVREVHAAVLERLGQ